MKRIDIVMAQSKNKGKSRDNLISVYCPDDFIDGIYTSDCSKIRCAVCWNREDGEIRLGKRGQVNNEKI